jgi:hypothetical protein
MQEQIIQAAAVLFEQELGNFSGDLGTLEPAVSKFMLSLGNGLLQRLVANGSKGYQGSSIACNCGGWQKFVDYRIKSVHTLFGWITIKRAYYHCPHCGNSSIPYDEASGLGSEQLSECLAKACCMLAVDDSFEETSRKVEALCGQKISDNTVERIVHQVGSAALQSDNEQWDEFKNDKQVPEGQNVLQRLYIAPDGTTVHEEDGWHEAKIGCIYWENEAFERHRKYVGRFDNSEVFGNHLWLEACRWGLREAAEIVYLGDGAAWIRTIHGTHFRKATFIVDWYHASEHIWDCGKILFGEGSQAAKRWVEHRQSLLWDGWTRKLLNDLKRQTDKYDGDKLKAIETLHHYISVNEEQMRYDVFRKKGYDIGSGAVEGACKHVVGKRLKQSGMIWTRPGSSAVLALRITWLNKEWENLWSQKPLVA